MVSHPSKLDAKIEDRRSTNAFRDLFLPGDLVDFSSNDCLGFARNTDLFNQTHQFLLDKEYCQNGSTGSRLLTGNHPVFTELEILLCLEHNSEAALVFNSGYDANLGFLSSVPLRGDVVLYDEYAHASIRDGLRLSVAKTFKFRHNNMDSLVGLLKKHSNSETIYVVTESVFSMDGDSPDLKQLIQVCNDYNAFLIIDEAHGIGAYNYGLLQDLKLEDKVFARIITFGKALGSHGAAVLGSKLLRDYLVNFARSFIYTTAAPTHTLAGIICAYKLMKSPHGEVARTKLQNNIAFFKNEVEQLGLKEIFIESNSAIQSALISGNKRVRETSLNLKDAGFDVRPILYPTVPEGSERLRFCVHSFNSKEEISKVLQLLSTFAGK